MQRIWQKKIRWMSYDCQFHETSTGHMTVRCIWQTVKSYDSHMIFTHLTFIWLSDASDFIWLSYDFYLIIHLTKSDACDSSDCHMTSWSLMELTVIWLFIWFCVSDVFCHMTFRKFIENSWYKKIIWTKSTNKPTTSTRDRLHNQRFGRLERERER